VQTAQIHTASSGSKFLDRMFFSEGAQVKQETVKGLLLYLSLPPNQNIFYFFVFRTNLLDNFFVF
jgi:hypothetical protein